MKFVKIIVPVFALLFLLACSAEKTASIAAGKVEFQLAQIQQQWILVGIDQQAIDSKISSDLTIEASTKANGNFACNYFFGTVEVQNSQLRIAKMGSTRRLCRAIENETETIVSTILSDWSKVLITGNELTLIGKSHRLNYKIKP